MKKITSNLIHSTCVSLNKKGILIIGKSSAGKSSLGLDLIFAGGNLISDDITEISLQNNDLIAYVPKNLPRGLEVRNFGIIKVPMINHTIIDIVIDLNKVEKKRIPKKKYISIMGIKKPYYRCRKIKNLYKIIYLITKYGKVEIDDLIF